jgi:tripartite-type tricarboxylate transporter receptor subunit TctC
MIPVRREFLKRAGATIAASAFPQFALALDYPIRPIRLIVPSAAGGPVDVIARLIAQKLSEHWGQPIHIENIPAGAGNVGIAAAAKAPPDGYTILATTSSYVVNPSLYAKIPYDPIRDLAPISLVAASGHVLVVHPSIPAKDVEELVALVRANPRKYSYASPGVGTTGQMAGELFKLALGLDLVHVPFNGAAPAVTATIGGHTPIAFLALPGVATNIKDGTLRALAVTSGNRALEFPNVPTLTEAGYPDQESIFMQSFLAPARTPKDIIDLWYREIVRIVAIPDVEQRLAAMSFEPVLMPPQEFGAWIKTEVARWAKVIRTANINKIE